MQCDNVTKYSDDNLQYTSIMHMHQNQHNQQKSFEYELVPFLFLFIENGAINESESFFSLNRKKKLSCMANATTMVRLTCIDLFSYSLFVSLSVAPHSWQAN